MGPPVQVRNVVAVVDDLLFGVKISDAARRLGAGFRFVKTMDEAWAAAGSRPNLIILDLNIRTIKPLELVTRLKADPATAPIPVVAYLSHVQVEFRKKAEEAGCDRVMARSTFSTSVLPLLAEFVGAEAQAQKDLSTDRA